VLYFLVISVFYNIYINIMYFIQNRLCIRPKRMCQEICSYLLKISRKIYTYNFYSYDKSDFLTAFFLNIIFLAFISTNVIYVTMRFSIFLVDHDGSTTVDTASQLLYLFAFETHLFIDIFCPIYYRGISFQRSFKLALLYFAYANIALFSGVFTNLFFTNDHFVKFLLKISHMAYIMIVSYLYARAYKTIRNIGLNDLSWKIYFNEKAKFLNQRNPVYDTEQVMELEATTMSSLKNNDINIILQHTYYKVEDKNFFKRRNRYYYKTLLMICYGGLFFLFVCEFGYVILRLLILENIADDDTQDIITDWRKLSSNIFSVTHMTFIIFTSWNIFMKLEIKTIVLY